MHVTQQQRVAQQARNQAGPRLRRRPVQPREHGIGLFAQRIQLGGDVKLLLAEPAEEFLQRCFRLGLIASDDVGGGLEPELGRRILHRRRPCQHRCRIPLQQLDIGQLCLCHQTVGLQAHRLPRHFGGIVEAAERREVVGQVDVHHKAQRVGCNRPAFHRHGLIELSHGRQTATEVGHRPGVMRIQFQPAPVFGQRPHRVAVGAIQHRRVRLMRHAQIGRQRQRLVRRSPRFPVCLVLRSAGQLGAETHLGERQPGVRVGVVRIDPDGLMVKTDRLAQPIERKLRGTRLALQQRRVRRDIASGWPVALAFHGAAVQQLGLQGAGHGRGDGILQGEQVGARTLVMLRPDDAAIIGVDQVRGDAHLVARVLHAAFQQMCNTEFLPDLLAGVLAVAELER